MSHNINELKQFNRKELETYLHEFGKMLAKKLRNKHVKLEIILVGGASILLNYNFRLQTEDIDCLDPSNQLMMNDLVNAVAKKYNLNYKWINTDFVNSDSYTDKLIQYCEPYDKVFGYGVLNIRTIKNEYLVAMKIKSARFYKHDLSDICGIIQEQQIKNKPITIEKLNKAIIDLYNDNALFETYAYKLAVAIINGDKSIKYEDIVNTEARNKELLDVAHEKYMLHAKDIVDLFKKLELKQNK